MCLQPVCNVSARYCYTYLNHIFNNFPFHSIPIPVHCHLVLLQGFGNPNIHYLYQRDVIINNFVYVTHENKDGNILLVVAVADITVSRQNQE